MRERGARAVLRVRLEQRFLHDVACSLQEEVAGADDVAERFGPFFELHAGWRSERVDRERRAIASNSEDHEPLAPGCAQQAAVVAFEVEDHKRNACRLYLD